VEESSGARGGRNLLVSRGTTRIEK